jgi:hypothetical protein
MWTLEKPCGPGRVCFSLGAEQASDRWLSSRRRIETEEAALAKPLGLDTPLRGYSTSAFKQIRPQTEMLPPGTQA